MPTYEVTDPATGRTLELTGDSPPTEKELTDIFARYGAAPAPKTLGQKVLDFAGRNFGDTVPGIEMAGTPGEGVETFAGGVIGPTLKAVPRVTGATLGSLATGLGGMAMHVPYMIGDVAAELENGAKLADAINRGALTASNRTMATMAFPSQELLTTPEERKGFENANILFGNAGRGWKGIGELAATGSPEKATDVIQGRSEGSSILVPLLGALGDTSEIMALAGAPKAARPLIKKQIVRENASTSRVTPADMEAYLRREGVPEDVTAEIVAKVRERGATVERPSRTLVETDRALLAKLRKAVGEEPYERIIRELEPGKPKFNLGPEKPPQPSALPPPPREGRLSNPIIAEALLKAAREKALPGPEGMDMNIGQDFTVTPSRALADMIIRSGRGRLPAGQTPMLPEPPASSKAFTEYPPAVPTIYGAGFTSRPGTELEGRRPIEVTRELLRQTVGQDTGGVLRDKIVEAEKKPKAPPVEGDYLSFKNLKGVAQPLTGYPGNKRTMLQAKAYDNIIVPGQSFDRIVEPFGGSGMLGNALNSRLRAPRTLNDLDDNVVNFHNVAKNNIHAITTRLQHYNDSLMGMRHKYPTGGEVAHGWIANFWKTMTGRYASMSPEDKAAWFALQNQGAVGVFGRTQKIISGAKAKAPYSWHIKPQTIPNAIKRITMHAEALKDVDVTRMDARELLRSAKAGDLLVVDPPYVPLADEGDVLDYAQGKDLATLPGAINFIMTDVKAAADRGVPVIYTNNASPEIIKNLQLAGFNTKLVTVRSQTRGGESGKRTEVIGWRNLDRAPSVGRRGDYPQGTARQGGREAVDVPDRTRPGEMAPGNERRQGVDGEERSGGAGGVTPGTKLYDVTSVFTPEAWREVFGPLASDLKRAIPKLEELGQRVYASGKQTAKAWVVEMKRFLGDLWPKFKAYLSDIWKKIGKPVRNERGAAGDAELPPEKLAARERLKEDARKMADAAKREGVALGEYLGKQGIEGPAAKRMIELLSAEFGNGELARAGESATLPPVTKKPGTADIPAKTTPEAVGGRDIVVYHGVINKQKYVPGIYDPKYAAKRKDIVEEARKITAPIISQEGWRNNPKLRAIVDEADRRADEAIKYLGKDPYTGYYIDVPLGYSAKDLSPEFSNDIGLHFGTEKTAREFAKDKGVVFKARINAQNIIEIPDIFSRNYGFERAIDVLSDADALKNGKYLTLKEEGKKLDELQNSLQDYRDVGTRKEYVSFWKNLRKSIKTEIDAFRYKNEIEGEIGEYSYSVLKKDLIEPLPSPSRPLEGGGRAPLLASERGSTGDLSQSEIVAALRKTKDSIDTALPHLERLGRSIYESGKTDLRAWATAMKRTLGDLWDSFKDVMVRVWRTVSKPIRNEKGAVGVDINAADPIVKRRIIRTSERTKLEKDVRSLEQVRTKAETELAGLTEARFTELKNKRILKYQEKIAELKTEEGFLRRQGYQKAIEDLKKKDYKAHVEALQTRIARIDDMIARRKAKTAATKDTVDIKAPAVRKSEVDFLKSLPDLRWKPLEGKTENPIYTLEHWVDARAGEKLKELFYYPFRTAHHKADLHFDKIHGKLEEIRKGLPSAASRNIYTHALFQEKGGAEILAEMGIKEPPKLTAAELKAYNWMRRGYEVMYERLNKARIEAGLEPFRKVANYFTFARDLGLAEQLGFRMDDPLFAEHMHRKATAFQYAKERVGGMTKADLDAFGVFDRYMRSATRHVHLSPEIAKMRELLGTFREGKGVWSFADKHPRGHKALVELIDYVSGQRKRSVLDPVLNLLNHNITTATLSANLRSALIQPTALLNTYIEIGPKYTAIGTAKLARKINRESAMRDSETLFGRQFDVSVAESLQGAVRMMGKAREKWNKSWFGMRALRELDLQTATATWEGAYEKAIQVDKMAPEAARRYADDVVVRTQGSAAPHDLSPIQRTAWGKALTLFQTFVINNWNFLTKKVLGIRNADMGNKAIAGKVIRLVIGTTIINSLFDLAGIDSPLPAPIDEYMEQKRRGKTTGEALTSASLEFTQLVPGLGGLRYGSGVLGATADYVGDVSKKVAAATGRYVGPTKPAAELAGKALGIPGTTQASKAIRIAGKGGSPADIILGRYPEDPETALRDQLRRSRTRRTRRRARGD